MVISETFSFTAADTEDLREFVRDSADEMLFPLEDPQANAAGDGANFDWQITVPANTTATVYVPANTEESVTEGGRPASRARGVQFVRMEDARAVFHVGSGRYRFTRK